MGTRYITLKTPEDVMRDGKDYWTLCDSPRDLSELPVSKRHSGTYKWQGGSYQNAKRYACDGKLDEVAPSDRWLEKFESEVEHILTPTTRLIDDVAGAVPNVPAFLAGQPLAMRRRTRDESDRSPVCVIVDTTISAGCSHAEIQKRGAVILALVRLLSVRRPLELWAGVGLDAGSHGAAYTFTKLDTTPLDLARAAFMLCHPLATRCLGYGTAQAKYKAGINWPYLNYRALKVSEWRSIAAQAFPHLVHFVPVPGLDLNDPLLANPSAWISERLHEFGELTED